MRAIQTIAGGAHESDPLKSDDLLTILRLQRWAEHFGLDRTLSSKNLFRLADRLAKELEIRTKRPGGRPKGLRSGADAAALVAEINALRAHGMTRQKAAEWLVKNADRYKRKTGRFGETLSPASILTAYKMESSRQKKVR